MLDNKRDYPAWQGNDSIQKHMGGMTALKRCNIISVCFFSEITVLSAEVLRGMVAAQLAKPVQVAMQSAVCKCSLRKAAAAAGNSLLAATTADAQ